MASSRRESRSFVKTVILAGGRGTRLSEETHAIPKPMVAIGGRPILWHIMSPLRPLRVHRLRGRPGLQGLRHQGVLRQPAAPRVRHVRRPATGTVRVPVRQRPGLEGHPDRHRRGQHDRRPARAAARAPRRALPADLRRRSLRRPDRRGRRAPRADRRPGDHHRRAPAAAVRRARGRRRQGLALPREAARGARPGSTAGTSWSSPRSSTWSTTTRRVVRVPRRSAPSPSGASSAPTSTTGSGCRWTPLRERDELNRIWDSGYAPWAVERS